MGNSLEILNNTAILNDDDMPLTVYHGTFEEFDHFDAAFFGSNTDNNATSEGLAQTAHLGFWFNSDGDLDSTYTHKIACHLNIENPYHIESLSDLALLAGEEGADQMRERLISEGYDGIIVETDEEFGGTSYIAFSPEQIIIIK